MVVEGHQEVADQGSRHEADDENPVGSGHIAKFVQVAVTIESGGHIEAP